MTARQRLGRIPDSVLDEIRARLPIEAVVGRHVDLRKKGSWHMGLCPFHGENRPSFAVRPDRRNFHCFGCNAHGDVIRFVAQIEGLSFPEAARRCAAEAGMAADWQAEPAPAPWQPRKPAAVAAARPDDGDVQQRTARAARIWKAGAAILEGSPQAAYLAGRGLWPLPDACHAVLRAGCGPHPEASHAAHPILLARIDGPDGTFRGVHRTWLGRGSAGWGKLGGVGDPRLSLGPLKGNAIRLFPVAERLGVAEGIETALAAYFLSGVPTWSCLNAGALAAVELPFDIAELVIFADRDKPRLRAEGHRGQEMPEGAGIFHARMLARRQAAAAVAVDVRAPKERGDYADLWLRQRAEVAA